MKNEKEILNKKNILLDKSLSDFFSDFEDKEKINLFLEKFSNFVSKKFITKKILIKNSNKAISLLKELFEEEIFFELISKLGLDSQEEQIEKEKSKTIEKINGSEVRILHSFCVPGRSLKVKDFVTYFRNRFSFLSKVLEGKNLENLTSIGKISNERQKLSVIGMVTDKQTTKNNNLILEIEDLTGKTKVLISSSKKELLLQAEDICLDSVLGFSGVGNKDILFVNELFFPSAVLAERKNSPIDENAIFIGDLHYGSKNFMEKSFDKFINYLSDDGPEEAKKIKYLFIVGDLVAGIGNYPGQEFELLIDDLELQFEGLAKKLENVRKDIKIIVSPGNHDGVRLMEPQPILNEKFAWPLFELENVVFVENPFYVNIGKQDSFEGYVVFGYHGFSFPYYANNISTLMHEDAMNSPEKIMRFLLKHRHVAPAHMSTQYFPSKKDGLLMREIPDIFVSGHTHKSGICYENNILLVSVSSWEGLTSYQEKFGNRPDHCKVPMINLKTRAVKILDFEMKEEGIKVYEEEENE